MFTVDQEKAEILASYFVSLEKMEPVSLREKWMPRRESKPLANVNKFCFSNPICGAEGYILIMENGCACLKEESWVDSETWQISSFHLTEPKHFRDQTAG